MSRVQYSCTVENGDISRLVLVVWVHCAALGKMRVFCSAYLAWDCCICALLSVHTTEVLCGYGAKYRFSLTNETEERKCHNFQSTVRVCAWYI